jgi:hypothetical protein
MLFDAQGVLTPDPGGTAVGAKAEIWTNGLLVKPTTGARALYLPFIELLAIRQANYKLSLQTTLPERTMTLSQLGSRFDQFALKLVDSWGDCLAKALLMHEAVTVYEARCSYSIRRGDAGGAAVPSQQQAPSPPTGSCRARIYQTSLVILPSEEMPRKYPLSSMTSLSLENYRIRIASDGGGRDGEQRGKGVLELMGLGYSTQPFFDKLVGAQKDLETDTIGTIKTMLPSVGYAEVDDLAGLMAEGRAAMRQDVERVSPDAWSLLAKKVMEGPLAQEFQHLTSAVTDLPRATAIGLKKMKDDVYVWFLVLVKGSAEAGGNALIMEITSEKGHATYLFRVMDRGEDALRSEMGGFQEAGEAMIASLNDAMVATSFRREPVYASDDMLNTARYSKYLYASKKLPELVLLRERFFARIIHTTPESWKQNLQEALAFNTSPSTGPGSRWSKSAVDGDDNDTPADGAEAPDAQEIDPAATGHP